MRRLLTLALSVVMVLVYVIPVYAQLGDVDNSSFTVQNVGTASATVQISFFSESGSEIVPTTLNAAKANPFTLAIGESFEVYVPGITSLPAGRYSVVIASDQPVVAIANLIGQNSAATVYYNGSYSGASAGAASVNLPSVTHAYYNWNSLISVQNAGTQATDITVSYFCGGSFQQTKSNILPGAAAHFDLETAAPAGMGGCAGSAVITSSNDQPLVAVDNQTAAGGFTQSFNAFAEGSQTVYVPAMYEAYYTWNSSLNIAKIGAGVAAVTVEYSDGSPDSTCNLTDAAPSCLLYMPTAHGGTAKLFAATVTSVGQPVVAIINSANPTGQAQTYGGFPGGAGKVGLPTVMKKYYGWDTSFTCQNVGSVATTLGISYQGYAANAYNSASIPVGGSVEVYQPGEAFLPTGYRGSVTVTANATGGEVVCIVNQTNGSMAGKGDWSMSYNAQ